MVFLSTVMASEPQRIESEALVPPKGAVTAAAQVPQTADEELPTFPVTHLEAPVTVVLAALRVLAPQQVPAVALQSLLAVQVAPRAPVYVVGVLAKLQAKFQTPLLALVAGRKPEALNARLWNSEGMQN